MKNENIPSERKILGQRIRDLRIQRGMTQKQLAQDTFTRNMISLIESGSASPSMETLTVIAQRLDVPVGYFFAASKEEIHQFTKMSLIKKIRQLYARGDYQDCITLCAPLDQADEEIQLILAECKLALARQACSLCMLTSASTLLNSAIASADRTIYGANRIRATAKYLLTLIQGANQTEIPRELALPSCFPGADIPPEFFVYIRALILFDEGRSSEADALRRSELISSQEYLDLLCAKSFIAAGQIDQAIPLLRDALSNADIGFFTKFHVLSAMELCASTSSDFKAAYQISRQKVHLLEQFSK